MMMSDNLPKEIKWRGSSYLLESVDGDRVNWVNATSRHHESCPIEAWKRSDPYDGRYS